MVKDIVQGHTASEQQSRDSDSGVYVCNLYANVAQEKSEIIFSNHLTLPSVRK